MQFLEGLEWGEVIDREVAEFVEEGIFGVVEEGFLSAALHWGFSFGDAGASIGIEVIIFQ